MSSKSTSASSPPQQQPRWYQKQISITAPSRGCHLITSDIVKSVQTELSSIKIGMANIFIQHTSASITINENADPDVRRDLEVALNKIVPASWNHDGTFRHTMEGDDDMPGHVKTSLIGPSLNIPIQNGRFALGTWQGIYLNEHRDQGGWGGGHTRNIIITLQGQG
jgi:secondary thiamine-phosphate synthase enzyme